MTSLVRLIEKAEDLIFNPENWMQGGCDEQNQKWCAMGAIHYIASFDDEMRVRILEAEFFYHLPEQFDSLIEFNDDPSTTHDDILELFSVVYEKVIADEQP